MQAAVRDPTLLTVPQLVATVIDAAPLLQPFKATAARHGTTAQGWPSALVAVEQFASLQVKADAHRLASKASLCHGPYRVLP
jgi:hypothetical protein